MEAFIIQCQIYKFCGLVVYMCWSWLINVKHFLILGRLFKSCFCILKTLYQEDFQNNPSELRRQW